MFSFGLLILASFAPLSEIPHEILMLTASMGMLVYVLTDSPASRREVALLLFALATLVPFALLVSIDPMWVIFGSIAVYIGIPLWEVVKREHAEYLAEPERSSDTTVTAISSRDAT